MQRIFLALSLFALVLAQTVGFAPPATAQVTPTPTPNNTTQDQRSGNNTAGIVGGLLVTLGLYELFRPHHAPRPAPTSTSAAAAPTPPTTHTSCEKGSAGYEAMKRGLLPPDMETDPTDSNSAYDSKTGQNAFWDDTKLQWIDGKTGQPIGAPGGSCALSENLRELNNKLARKITELQQSESETALNGAEIERLYRTFDDLELTKMRAVDGLPKPYDEIFKHFECMSKEFKIGRDLLRNTEKNRLGHSLSGKNRGVEIRILKYAKACKDRLELLLQAGP